MLFEGYRQGRLTPQTKKNPLKRGGLVINLLSKGGVKGQSKTDTGLPRLVFEFDDVP
mgnify:CR=1 FL=1